MNTLTLNARTIIRRNLLQPRGAYLAAALALAAAAGPARADVPAVHYQDEVLRCVAGLRADYGPASAQRLRFQVTDLERTAGWYVIRIETQALDATGQPVGTARTSRCAASRWDHQLVLERNYAGGGLQQLLRQPREPVLAAGR